MDTSGHSPEGVGDEERPLVSTLYKCSTHGVWLELRTESTTVGMFRFWQCPVWSANGKRRCQYCKPCKYGLR